MALWGSRASGSLRSPPPKPSFAGLGRRLFDAMLRCAWAEELHRMASESRSDELQTRLRTLLAGSERCRAASWSFPKRSSWGDRNTPEPES